jgi:hypothetical protein
MPSGEDVLEAVHELGRAGVVEPRWVGGELPLVGLTRTGVDEMEWLWAAHDRPTPLLAPVITVSRTRKRGPRPGRFRTDVA